MKDNGTLPTMPFTIAETRTGLVVELEGVLTAQHARELWTRLEAAVSGGKAVEVRTERLLDADTSVLQIVLSLQKTVADFHIDSASQGFVDAVERCGLQRSLAVCLRDAS